MSFSSAKKVEVSLADLWLFRRAPDLRSALMAWIAACPKRVLADHAAVMVDLQGLLHAVERVAIAADSQ